ncbi:magnesium citrate secondary transporter [Algoriphagus sp. D3-2-R+10]|uniref:magnesium citrate secondary transporter n=1 Tax=Algoriphagus aurantiacus TaxID=3103948 RepID=UPI002B3D8C4B|nr:magnesium citrate secondary transporter [Algoriphagus sp. D3-2-R+10]MEB2774775.1 magnesium citrate secondary transporter [Algoriphagus sp. D3-2-R+10]
MISLFKNPIFIFASVAFWVNQYLEKSLGVFVPIYHSYGDDLMAMPVVFGICLQVMRWWHPAGEELIFTRNQVLIGLVYLSVTFEGVLPLISENYTADFLDILCYTLGTVVFYRFMNKPAPQSKKSQAL